MLEHSPTSEFPGLVVIGFKSQTQWASVYFGPKPIPTSLCSVEARITHLKELFPPLDLSQEIHCFPFSATSIINPFLVQRESLQSFPFPISVLFEFKLNHNGDLFLFCIDDFSPKLIPKLMPLSLPSPLLAAVVPGWLTEPPITWFQDCFKDIAVVSLVLLCCFSTITLSIVFLPESLVLWDDWIPPFAYTRPFTVSTKDHDGWSTELRFCA